MGLNLYQAKCNSAYRTCPTARTYTASHMPLSAADALECLIKLLLVTTLAMRPCVKILSPPVVIVIRLHRSCGLLLYRRWSSVVCRFVTTVWSLQKRPDHDVIRDVDTGGPKEPFIRWDTAPHTKGQF